jgi:oxygen-independent coproporphyrinogen-3 oxidase
VPWIKPQQRIFKDEDLPTPEMKRILYEIARERFLKAGYLEVGMDHFALPSDQLFTAREENRLHRNFMGYTDQKSDLLLGLGVSSISESKNQFHQNEKLLPKFQEPILAGKIATHRGHILSERDQVQRRKILEMMTSFKLELSPEDYHEVESLLTEFISEGLVQVHHGKQVKIEILEAGKPFLRNIGSVLDDYIVRELKDGPPGKKLFSKSI